MSDDLLELTTLYVAQPWRKRAACAGLDPDLFFPAKNSGQGAAEDARRVCASCPVREDCLTDALDTFDHFGVRGGMSPKERRKEATRRRRLSRDAEMAS